jgi:small GTP-binding protein
LAEEKKTYKFKVTLFGAPSVGKTSLILRFIKESFSDDLKKTIGTNFLIKDIVLEDVNVRLLVWDIGGQAQFSDLRSVYFKGSNAAIGVYDVTSPDSLLKLPGWVSVIKKTAGKIPMVIIGNKVDLVTPEMNPTKEEALEFAKSIEAEHVYTSAATGIGVEETFTKIAKKSLEIAKQFEQ